MSVDLTPEEMGIIVQISQRWPAPDVASIRLKHSLESKLLAAMEAAVKKEPAK